MYMQEVRVLFVASFPGSDEASRRPDSCVGSAGRVGAAAVRGRRRDVLRSQENNRRRKDADVSYVSTTGVVAARNCIRRASAKWSWQASRRSGLIIDRNPPPVEARV
jgi:hypothetical protein